VRVSLTYTNAYDKANVLELYDTNSSKIGLLNGISRVCLKYTNAYDKANVLDLYDTRSSKIGPLSERMRW